MPVSQLHFPTMKPAASVRCASVQRTKAARYGYSARCQARPPPRLAIEPMQKNG